MGNTTTPGTSSRLLGQVDAGWRDFRAAVRDIGRARLEEPTGAGWSFHDLVAHVSGWHDLTARRLRVYRMTGAVPGPGDEAALGIAPFANADELNERLVSSHRLVGPEALVDELDATFREVRAELAQLTDEQIDANDGWVARVVAGNTFGHYAEHATEIA